MPYRGSTLILDRGRIRITSDSIVFPPELSYGTNEEFIKMFVLTYVKFLSDSPLFSESGDKPVRLYASFLRTLTNEHVSAVIKRYSGLSNELLQGSYTTGDESSTRFFVPGMKDTPVFKEYLTWYKTGRPELLKYVNSFLLFGKKLEYVDPEFDTTALRGWYEVEERLHTLTFAKTDVDALSNIVSVLVAPAAELDLLPKFGPGRVMERGVVNQWDKLRSLTHDHKLAYAFLRERPFRGAEAGYGEDHALSELVCDATFVSRLKFVPKDIFKSRSICMEPNGYMYYQQEVLRLLVSSMERGLIRKFVNLHDQTENRYSATHGSKYLSSDTIDLSSASDSVHVDLVRKIFPKDLLFYMLATRTSKVLVPDRKEPIAVKKFAPMGSAVCFPTQCIIFTAVCVYAYMSTDKGIATGDFVPTQREVRQFISQRLHRRRNEATPFTQRYEPPVVFGDDIICDSRVTENVITTLRRLGFQPNEAKSFRGSQSFRESCGVYAYQGDDVTPIQFRVPFFTKGRGNWDAKIFSSFIEAINKFNSNGYTAVGSFLLSILKDHGYKYRVPFTTDQNAFGIYTRNKHAVDGAHLIWNANWQTYLEEVLGIAQKRPKDLGDEPKKLESYRYVQWWRARVRRDTPRSFEEGFSLRIRPEETRVVPVWTRYEM